MMHPNDRDPIDDGEDSAAPEGSALDEECPPDCEDCIARTCVACDQPVTIKAFEGHKVLICACEDRE